MNGEEQAKLILKYEDCQYQGVSNLDGYNDNQNTVLIATTDKEISLQQNYETITIKNCPDKKTLNGKNFNKENYIKEFYDNLEFSRYHFFLILSIFLIRTIEGTEVLTLSIASEMLEKNFNLIKNSSSYINVIILSGNLLGCLISMTISNRFPRKFFIKISVFLMIIPSICSLLAQNILFFTCFRYLVNIGIGLYSAAAVSLVAESTNPNYRGFILNLILVSGSVGEIFISFSLGKIVNLENPTEWSKLFMVSLSPVIILNFN
jgi:hypothetical protein